MKQTAILLGATGLTGGFVLDKLLEEAAYEKVIVLGRSSVERSHPKLEEHIIDLFKLEENTSLIKGDVLFCCVGTTKAKTPDKKKYKKIDKGIPVSAAKISKAQGIDCFLVISALGADPDSNTFYNRVKGEMEQEVLSQQIPHTYILQPSLIGGDREESRTAEGLAQWLMGTFSFLVPSKYKMIHPETLAEAMVQIAMKGHTDTRILNEQLRKIGANES